MSPTCYFTVPAEDRAAQPTEIGEINKAIKGLFSRITESSEIYIALWQWNLDVNGGDPVAEALAQALLKVSANPVQKLPRARLLYDQGHPFGEKTSEAFQKVKKSGLLKAFPVHGRNLEPEGHVHAMHNKFFILKNIVATEGAGLVDVVAVSSANIANTQLSQANALVVFEGYTKLIDGYYNYWQKIRNTDANDFVEENVKDNNSKAYLFPNLNKAGKKNPDTLVSVLKNIQTAIKKYNKVSVGKATIDIRCSMAFWTADRADIAFEISECFQNNVSSASKVGFALRSSKAPGSSGELGNPAIAYEIQNAIRDDKNLRWMKEEVYWFPPNDASTLGYTHNKYLIYQGPYTFDDTDPTKIYKIVWHGSSNWTKAGMYYDWDYMIRILDDSVYDAFYANYRKTIRLSEPWTDNKDHPQTNKI